VNGNIKEYIVIALTNYLGSTTSRLVRTTGIFCIGLLLAVASINDALAINPLGTAVGAIRWDGWIGDQYTGWPGAPYVGQDVERAMGPLQYHYRLPFYAQELSTNSVQVRMDSQAKMDAEIAYAQDAGLTFWAFDYYNDGSGLDQARHLYHSSTVRTTLQFCYVIGDYVEFFANYVEDFKKPHYQKVLGNRPLLFWLSAATSAMDAFTIQGLRDASIAAGAGNPYIVALAMDPNAAASWASYLGMDAVSSYATPYGSGGQHSFYQLANSEVQRWDSYNWAAWNQGKKIVPFVTTGWDPRPMMAISVPWYAQLNSAHWVGPATAAEVGQQLQRAINWQQPHWNESEANVILMYAWNEFSEGGYICPTLGTGTDRLNAIKEVLRERPPADPNMRNVYQFYHAPPYQDRFYALDYNEGISNGFVSQGIGFVTHINPIDSDMYPLYRCNTGRHFVSMYADCEGYLNEGSYGYVSSIARSGYTPLYRFQKGYEHLATKNYAEGAGWNYEGILGYVIN
jgi:hypothetical protein